MKKYVEILREYEFHPESGMIHSAQNVYTEYPNPRRDEWQTKILPALKKVPLSVLMEKSGKSRRMLIDTRAGRSRPHRKNQELLTSILRKTLRVGLYSQDQAEVPLEGEKHLSLIDTKVLKDQQR